MSDTQDLERRLKAAEAECLEQCRLIAMGGEREARLMAENAALREALEQAMKAAIDAARKE